MKKKILYHTIEKKIENKIYDLIDNGYEQAALGTIDKKSMPFVSKGIPSVIKNRIYLLLSDLSEHTTNLMENPVGSLYFAAKEQHKTRSNNARLTLQGTVTKVVLKKSTDEFKLLINNHSEIDKGSDMWAYFEDFNFYEFHERRKLYVEGFGKAYEKVLN